MFRQGAIAGPAILLVLSLATRAVALPIAVPLTLDLVPGGGDNAFSLTLDAGVFGAPKDVSAATGHIPVELELTFDPFSHVAAVEGITFPEQTPGSISFGDMHFDLLSGLEVADLQGLKATWHTLSAPGPVSGGSFPINYHELAINDGEIVVTGMYGMLMDFNSQPARSGPGSGPNGTITVTPAQISSDAVTYDADLLLPISFRLQMNGSPPLFAIGDGTFHAVGSFSHTFAVPEPGTIALLVSLAASLAGFYRLRGKFRNPRCHGSHGASFGLHPRGTEKGTHHVKMKPPPLAAIVANTGAAPSRIPATASTKTGLTHSICRSRR